MLSIENHQEIAKISDLADKYRSRSAYVKSKTQDFDVLGAKTALIELRDSMLVETDLVLEPVKDTDRFMYLAQHEYNDEGSWGSYVLKRSSEAKPPSRIWGILMILCGIVIALSAFGANRFIRNLNEELTEVRNIRSQ
jgi:hypothetical protein